MPEWSKGPHSRCGELFSREFKSHCVHFFYFTKDKQIIEYNHIFYYIYPEHDIY